MAEPALEALVEVQGHDLAADQLRYRRHSLPERSELGVQRRALAQAEAGLLDAGERLALKERTQLRLEGDIESLEARAVESELRLYSGSIRVPKELQALSSEVDSLRRRKRVLEDELLEVMEAVEAVVAEAQDLEGERARVVAEAERLEAALAAQEADLDAELAAVATERDRAAALVGADLLATYERLRQRLDGIGVARLDAGRCTGCHLSLPAMELDALRRAEDGVVVRHEECGRILVR